MAEEDLTADVRDLTSSLREARGSCPPADTLVEYHELTGRERASHPIHDHVQICSRCQLVLLHIEEPQPAIARRRAWLMPLAAAAAVILAVAYFATGPREEGRVLRGNGDGVELISPSGARVPASDLRFEWRASESTTPHALRVLDPASPGEPVISRDSVSSGYQPTLEERQRLKSGITYRWFVEYRTPGGGTLTSAAGVFSVR